LQVSAAVGLWLIDQPTTRPSVRRANFWLSAPRTDLAQPLPEKNKEPQSEATTFKRRLAEITLPRGVGASDQNVGGVATVRKRVIPSLVFLYE
jgi:hypothetical protein